MNGVLLRQNSYVYVRVCVPICIGCVTLLRTYVYNSDYVGINPHSWFMYIHVINTANLVYKSVKVRTTRCLPNVMFTLTHLNKTSPIHTRYAGNAH